MTRLGIGLVGLISVGALFAFGALAMVVAFVLSAGLWFGIVMRRLRTRETARILAGDTVQIKAQK
jgi:hypothetical protein